ncbi:MAG: hypothetical protein H6509_13180 [Bryobacterales bacterium]|nr:hypothetical protein [Bryobacterales bacterium]
MASKGAAKFASPRVLPGLIIAALGALLLLNNFDILDIGQLRKLWPLLVVALGLHWAIEGNNKVLGGLVAAAGVALQLDKLGWVDVEWRELWRYWPVLLIAGGVGMMMQRGGRDNQFGGALLASIGAYLLASNLGWIQVEMWQLWPVAVILLGVAMIRKAVR